MTRLADPAKAHRHSLFAVCAVIIRCALLVIPVPFAVSFCRHAGPQWRDEANSIAVATGASLPTLFGRLTEDSFPILWFLVLRLGQLVGLLSSDLSYRILGLIIGLSLVAASGYTLRQMRAGMPVLSIGLIWLNPMLVRTFCSTRAYGLGTVLAILCTGAVWKMAQEPSRRNTALAAILCVAAAQCLFYNITFVVACCAAAAFVMGLRKSWPAVKACVGVALISGLSMSIYVPTILYQRHWATLIQRSLDTDAVQQAFVSALSGEIGMAELPPGMLRLWLAAGVVALLAAAYSLGRRNTARPLKPAGYLLLVAALSAAGQYAFYLVVGRPMIYWYLATLLTVVAVCADALVGSVCEAAGNARDAVCRGLQLGRYLLVAVLVVAFGHAAYRIDSVRSTNVDLAARLLRREASPGDFVLVSAYYYAPSVSRYYRGPAPWDTVPPVAIKRFGGPDFLQTTMDNPAPCAGVRNSIDRALSSGHAVWIVGQKLAPTGREGFGGPESYYLRHSNLWLIDRYFTGQMATYLTDKAALKRIEHPQNGQPIWPIEDVYVTRVSGLRK